MKTSGMDIRDHKKRGQWAELRFMAKATEFGYQLAKPVGDSTQYDVVVDLGGRFISVQVKSTFFQASNLKPGNFVASLVTPAVSTTATGDPTSTTLPFTVFLKISGTSSRGLWRRASSPSASARATNKTSGSTTGKPGICSTTVRRRHC